MPLSANFRREMLMAIKNAKKNKEKRDDTDNIDDGATSSIDTEDNSETNTGSALVLTKQVSSHSKDALNIDTKQITGGINLREKSK